MQALQSLLNFEEMDVAMCVVEQHVEQYILKIIWESLLMQVGGANTT
jgi:hypothetical protein